MKPLVGTIWQCRCGRERHRPVVSVDIANQLRSGLGEALQLLEEAWDCLEESSAGYEDVRERIRVLKGLLE